MTLLKEIDFIDLYLGKGYSEIKGLTGAEKSLTNVADSLINDTQHLQNICENVL